MNMKQLGAAPRKAKGSNATNHLASQSDRVDGLQLLRPVGRLLLTGGIIAIIVPTTDNVEDGGRPSSEHHAHWTNEVDVDTDLALTITRLQLGGLSERNRKENRSQSPHTEVSKLS